MASNIKLVVDHTGIDDWKYDPWGCAMAVHFAICDVLIAIGGQDGAHCRIGTTIAALASRHRWPSWRHLTMGTPLPVWPCRLSTVRLPSIRSCGPAMSWHGSNLWSSLPVGTTEVLAALAVTIPPVPASADTAILEDSAGWDCRVHGNRVCGPGNNQGVPAGDYSTGWLDYSADFGA